MRKLDNLRSTRRPSIDVMGWLLSFASFVDGASKRPRAFSARVIPANSATEASEGHLPLPLCALASWRETLALFNCPVFPSDHRAADVEANQGAAQSLVQPANGLD